jgi:hypothetical protein
MSSIAVLFVLYLVGRYFAKYVNENNLIVRSFKIFEDPRSVCNRCGRSVAFGSGLWTNRLRDYDSLESRKSKGAKYPEGNFICGECLKEISKKNENNIRS